MKGVSPMTIAQQLLPEFDHEMGTTRWGEPIG